MQLVAEIGEYVLARLPAASPAPPSPYLTVSEAAESFRCKRQRIDDLQIRRQRRTKEEWEREVIGRGPMEEQAIRAYGLD